MDSRAPERLRELQAGLARYSSVAMLLEDAGGRIVAASDRAAEMIGCTPETLLGRAFDALRPLAEGSTHRLRRERVPATGALLVESELWTTDGRRLPVEIQSRRATIGDEPCLHHTIRDLTDTLREHQWQRLFFELPFIGMAITSPVTQRWIAVNDELCRILGYPREQLQQMTWVQVTHPEDLATDLELADAVRSGRSDGYQMAKRYLHADGSVVHAAIDVRCVRKADRSVDYFVATIDDITSEVLARRELEHSRSVYATLSGTHAAVARIRNVPALLDEVCRVAVQGGGFMLAVAHRLAADGTLERIAARAVEPEMIRETSFASQGLSQEAIRSGHLCVANNLARGSLSDTWIGRVRTSGARSAAALPIYRGGRIAAVLALFASEADFFSPALERTVGEIGEGLSYALDSLDARAAVESSERTYRELFERHPMPMWVQDASTRSILAVNSAAVRHYGYTSEEFTRLRVDDLDAGDEPAGASDAPVTSSSATDAGFRRHRRRDGSVTEVELRSHAIAMDGRPARLVMATDVTARRRAEQALLESESRLRALNEDLEKRIYARTEELLLAKERAEESDRVKSLFLASVSHELRTPLNSIIGFSDVLLAGLAGTISEEQSKQIGIINASGRHLLALITDFLDISKIEAGALSLDMREVDLQAQLDRDVAAYRQAALERGLRLEWRPATAPLRVQADPRRLKQVVDNLVSNAVKFTDVGYVRIATEGDEEVVRLVVEDSGIGIEPAELQRLFEPFVRVEQRSKRPREGTGLGLAIARRLVRAMGGTIEAHSQPGAGSRFVVTLRRVAAR